MSNEAEQDKQMDALPMEFSRIAKLMLICS